MTRLEWWRWRHTLLLVATALFLLSYFGLVTWGHVEQALERLAAEGTIEVFRSPMGRGEAIITSFMFLMLSPLAVLAAVGLYTFSGAILAGFLRALVPGGLVPDWLFTTIAYCAIALAGWLARGVWYPWVREAVALIARAILVATT